MQAKEHIIVWTLYWRYDNSPKFDRLMDQEASGKVGTRTIGLVAEGRLLRVSKDNNLLRFAAYTIAEDRKSFDKLSGFKHQRKCRS